MKTHPKPSILLVISVLSGHLLLAQPALEFASGAGPTGNGSSIGSQNVTWENNTDNPTGNTFTSFAPTTTVTFTISNQRYALLASQSAIRAGVSFGGNLNNSGTLIGKAAIYDQMNFISNPSSSDFSSLPSTIGKGISLTSNYGVELFTSVMGLYNQNLATTGRYVMATLTVTFSNPVINPVLHFTGMGGFYQNLGFSTELDLLTTDVTLSKLSGSSELNVTSTSILNSANHPTSTTGSGAASGSVLVSGINITQLVFNVCMRGDGGESKWSGNNMHMGDAWLIGVSEETSMFVLPVKFSDFTATAKGNSAMLQWTTASEQNTDHFIVEYSQDGTSWQDIGTVKAAGNSGTPTNYSYIQYNPAAGNNFYRIAEVDLDGSYSYTQVQELYFSQPGAAALNFFPNPTRDHVTVTTGSAKIKSAEILTIDGKVVELVSGFRSGASIDLSRYPAGIYVLVFRNADGSAQTAKVQKN
ncbi:MAG TPA: T9SS type A sorting domain-containing protein [Puia sp.]|nr:T9SS type A sorting domain-containing protein [Puia sp.]